MKAMTLNEYGPDSEFEHAEIPTPDATDGHVVIQVAATSVNTVDTMIRNMGSDLPLSPALPAVLGMDFAGTIHSVGEGVTGFKVGDEVYGCAGGLLDLQGALAEYMLADANLIAHKPETISMREAAALPLVGITAYEGLTRASVATGQSILVHGGAGGVGHVAVQLAKDMGASVFATCSRPEQKAIIEGYGATAIDYRQQTVEDYVAEHTGGAGFDMIFDTVGGANMINSFEAATLNGHVSSTVSLLEIDLSAAHFKGLSLHVVFMLIPMMHNVKRTEHGTILAKLADLVDSGSLKPLLDAQSFTLDEVGKAHDHLASGQAIGKVVVTV